MTKKNRAKAYSYLRFSTPEQIAGDSLRRQMELAVRYAKDHELDLQEVSYQDLGVSAYRGKNVETGALSQFLEAVKTGAIEPGSYLLVENLDRISRAPPMVALNALQSILIEGIVVVTLTDNQKYTYENLNNDPTPLLMAVLSAIRANQESVIKSKRGKAAWVGKRLKAAETKLTARTPAWLKLNADRKTFSLVGPKVAAVRKVFDLADEGMSLHGIVRKMTEDRIPSLTDKLWTRVPLKRLLTSPSVIGTFSPHTVEYDPKTKKKVRVPAQPIPDYYPGIIHPDQFNRVQRMFDNALTGKAAREVNNIFAGVLRCGVCGSKVHLIARGKDEKGNPRPSYVACENRDRGKTAQAKRAALKIRRCTSHMVQYRHLEAAFLNMEPLAEVEKLTVNEDALERLNQLQSAKDTLQSTLDDLLAVKRSKVITAKLDEVAEELAEIEDQIDEAERAVADGTPSVLAFRMASLSGEMKTEPLDRAKVNALLRQAVEKVELQDSKGELQVHWKGSECVTEVAYRWPE